MDSLTIVPAIDLRGGRCVRLSQGRPDLETRYADDPVAVAQHWVELGAQYLHVVDLDGALEGRPVHAQVIRRIVEVAGVPVEVGGGLRTDEDIRAMLDAGVSRVILGTRVLEQPDETLRLVQWLGERLAVGLDVRNGRVRVRGWQAEASWSLEDAARRLDADGVQVLIVTDVTRDGMQAGVNTEIIQDVCRRVSAYVVASGGVRSAQDIRALTALKLNNLWGVIVGRALYEGSVSLPELLHAAAEPSPQA